VSSQAYFDGVDGVALPEPKGKGIYLPRIPGHLPGSNVFIFQADNMFENYSPQTAFFFPGQGAQKVGMAKVRLISSSIVQFQNA
jgi:hypothetical protein